jgi:hypothetical protein
MISEGDARKSDSIGEGDTGENYTLRKYDTNKLETISGNDVNRSYIREIPTAAARVQTRVWSSGIYGGQSGTGAGFLRVLRFPLSIFIPPNSPSS